MAGPQPDVTAFYQAQGPGTYLVQLRVTDTTSSCYPTSLLPDLTDTSDSAVEVVVMWGQQVLHVSHLAGDERQLHGELQDPAGESAETRRLKERSARRTVT